MEVKLFCPFSSASFAPELTTIYIAIFFRVDSPNGGEWSLIEIFQSRTKYYASEWIFSNIFQIIVIL